MNISKFFIDRPIFAGVLSTLVLVAGLISLFQLPISEYPEVIPPSVIDHAQCPGANPKVIAEFFGMIGVTMFGLMLTPVFYVLLRKVAGSKQLIDEHHESPHIVGLKEAVIPRD
jgi:multidrug efflux pump subunit AcrB